MELKNKLYDNIGKYRFEIRHVTVLFAVLLIFQIMISFVQKSSLENFLNDTQNWYQKDAAERLANLTTTSLELLLENVDSEAKLSRNKRRQLVESFNIIFSQQLLQQNVEEICLLVERGDELTALDNGDLLLKVFSEIAVKDNSANLKHAEAIDFYRKNILNIKNSEEIFSQREGLATFNILVPFVPKGEFVGALYMKNTPDFTFITREIISNYDETAIIYSSLILLGLLAMYYISSYTVKERDEAQKLFLKEQEEHIKEQIMYEKESLFTKRIYHTHHKAEKVMGFIKEDLRKLKGDGIEEIVHRLNKYSNFVSRVIYDMKWYDPPISTIRGQMFNTNLNEVIKFIVDNLFLRLSSKSEQFRFKLDLDENLPTVYINEFVIWEILEPLIQNSIDHANEQSVTINITTRYFSDTKLTEIKISDNGGGIIPELLEDDEDGIQRIFKENKTTKSGSEPNRGYGCYIAYQIAKNRCGWMLNVENIPSGGVCFNIVIKN